MPGEITFDWINHSGFVLHMGGRRIAVDPWVKGLAFDDSWALLAPSARGADTLEGVTDLWLSHEHPDHFSIQTLRQAPASTKQVAQVLFQRTRDHRVASACRRLGFANVTEIDPQWVELGPGLKAFCAPFGEGDSWLALSDGERTVLDLNDCICLDEAALGDIARITGPVSVLLTQFSYASWWGNPEDADAWRDAAQGQLEKIGREVRVLKPDYVLLCASFVYFCHADNWHMNRFMNTARTAVDYVAGLGGTTPVVLYPGDRWTVGTPHDSIAALDRYDSELKRGLAKGPLRCAQPVGLEALKAAAGAFIKRLSAENSRLLLWRIPRTGIWLKDLGVGVRLGGHGLAPDDGPFDVATTSDALLYCLNNGWGGETLKINGRFVVPEGGSADRFFRWFAVSAANMRGQRFDLSYYGRKLFGRWRTRPAAAAPGAP